MIQTMPQGNIVPRMRYEHITNSMTAAGRIVRPTHSSHSLLLVALSSGPWYFLAFCNFFAPLYHGLAEREYTCEFLMLGLLHSLIYRLNYLSDEVANELIISRFRVNLDAQIRSLLLLPMLINTLDSILGDR